MKSHHPIADQTILAGLQDILRGYSMVPRRELEPPDYALVKLYADEADRISGRKVGETYAIWTSEINTVKDPWEAWKTWYQQVNGDCGCTTAPACTGQNITCPCGYSGVTVLMMDEAGELRHACKACTRWAELEQQT